MTFTFSIRATSTDATISRDKLILPESSRELYYRLIKYVCARVCWAQTHVRVFAYRYPLRDKSTIHVNSFNAYFAELEGRVTGAFRRKITFAKRARLFDHRRM